MSKSVLESLDKFYIQQKGKEKKKPINLIDALDRLSATIPSYQEFNKLNKRITQSQAYIQWDQVKNNLDSFVAGDLIEDVWTDPDSGTEYNYPWQVMGAKGEEELEDGSKIHGIWLESKYATVNPIQFSHPRAAVKCPEGLAAGEYYLTIAAAMENTLPANTVISFTITQDIPVDGRIWIGYLYRTRKLWAGKVYAADGKTILEEFEIKDSTAGTHLGVIKLAEREGNLASLQEITYGYNNWAASAIRQYLNSDAGIGEWWQPYDDWDVAPDQLNQYSGFLAGMPKKFKEVLKPVKVVTNYNNTTDKENIVTYDKVTLSSLDQHYVTAQVNGNIEGEPFGYYKELNGTDTRYKQFTTYTDLIPKTPEDKAVEIYLRSAIRGNAGIVWYVYSYGYVYPTSASHALRAFPTIYIC